MQIIAPDWPAPRSVRGLTTTRDGGVSPAPYASLNLADHVGDDPARVSRNRARLVESRLLPHAPHWPRQVHGIHAVNAAELVDHPMLEADAVYTNTNDVVCAILTADCLPIILCSRAGDEVAVVHAGWRGLLDGIVASTLNLFTVSPQHLLAWIGPGISVAAYAVDAGFRDRFLETDERLSAAFSRQAGQWFADLGIIAEARLANAGIRSIARYRGCTFGEPARFFSYRRDRITGRIATCAWLTGEVSATQR